MTGVTISPGPPPAQPTAFQPFRRPLRRSTVREGVFVLQPQVPNSRKSSSRHAAPVSLLYPHPKGSSYHFATGLFIMYLSIFHDPFSF